MQYFLAPVLLAAAMLAAPLSASAQQLAFTNNTVEMRAGPDFVYPVVAVLPPGAQVAVQGCMPDYRWCDVAYGFNRGWVYGGALNYQYQQGYVTFSGIAPYIGVAILGFGLYDYWDRHYHDRPWYHDRDRWAHRLPPRYVNPPRYDHPPRYDRPPRGYRPAPGVQPRIPNAPAQPGEPGYVPHGRRIQPSGTVQAPPRVRAAPLRQPYAQPAPGGRIAEPGVRERGGADRRPRDRDRGDGRIRDYRPER